MKNEDDGWEWPISKIAEGWQVTQRQLPIAPRMVSQESGTKEGSVAEVHSVERKSVTSSI